MRSWTEDHFAYLEKVSEDDEFEYWRLVIPDSITRGFAQVRFSLNGGPSDVILLPTPELTNRDVIFVHGDTSPHAAISISGGAETVTGTADHRGEFSLSVRFSAIASITCLLAQPMSPV